MNMKKKIIVGRLLILLSFCYLTVATSAEIIGTNGCLSEARECTRLSISNAIEMAIKTNLKTLLANARNEEQRGRLMQSASSLLPHLLLAGQQGRIWRENPAAAGFKDFNLIGPYNSFDGRIQLVQRIFDLSAIEGYRAEKINSCIVQLEEELAAKQVIAAVCIAYLEVLHSDGELEAARADLELAQQLLKLGRHQNAAGLATSIDVTRFETRVAEEESRCLAAEINAQNSYIVLNRVSGLPLDTPLKLLDTLDFIAEQIASASAEINVANQNRTELKIADERITYSRFKLKQAQALRYPFLEATADYGLSGNLPSSSDGVGEMGIVLKIPIFEGNNIAGQIKEAKSKKYQSELVFADLDKQVQEDVHLALQSLVINAKQVEAARKVFGLCERELTMTRDLFSAGIGDNLQVINAQTLLANAREECVFALFHYQIARVNLYSALGNINTFTLAKGKEIEK
jgi:outer membrane protein TolC